MSSTDPNAKPAKRQCDHAWIAACSDIAGPAFCHRCGELADPIAQARAVGILNCAIYENGICLAFRDADGRIVDEHGTPMVADDEVSE